MMACLKEYQVIKRLFAGKSRMQTRADMLVQNPCLQIT